MSEHTYTRSLGFNDSSVGKKSTCNAEELGWQDPMEKGEAIHSRTLAWRISWIV